MKIYLNLRALIIVLLICIFFGSCAKETDLLSEYIIRDAGRKENSTSSNALPGPKIGTELITINDFPVMKSNRVPKVLEFKN